jgi:hypothetical protein
VAAARRREPPGSRDASRLIPPPRSHSPDHLHTLDLIPAHIARRCLLRSPPTAAASLPFARSTIVDRFRLHFLSRDFIRVWF